MPDPVPLEDTPEARALCYWAPGHHPRSFYARWRWLGTRNRALGLALALGRDGDPRAPVETWPLATGALYRQGGTYQLRTSRTVLGVEVWSNQGYKLDQLLMGRKRLPSVAVAIAARRA